MTTYVHQKQLY